MWWMPESKKEDRETLIILYKILVPISIVLVGFVLWATRNEPSAKESFLRHASSETFKGRVDSIYNDVPNHNARIALLSDGYKYGLYTEWAPEIELGDSLSKDTGSLNIQVYKKDGKRVTLNYMQLARMFDK
jgi:hypothetical protein